MQELLKKLFQESYKRTRWMRILYILAILVVFVTTYALIIPAITASMADLPEGFVPKASFTSGAAVTLDEPAVFTSGAAITLEPTLETYPAQHFKGSAGGVVVSVDADELTFPEGTVMSVTAADPDEVLPAVSSATPGRVTQVQAVDITFYNADGEEIEPLQPVSVSLSASDVPDSGDHYVVHVDDNGTGSLIDTDPLPVVAKAAKLLRSKAPMAAEPTREESLSTFTFETDGFSVYAIVTVNPADLDGQSFGILNNQNTVSGTALTAEAADGAAGLKGQTLVVRTDPIGRTDNVFVAKDSSITMWSFENILGSQYYIKAEADGAVKYLQVTTDGVALVDDPADASPITVTAGTGSYTGKYSFSNGSTYLYLNKGNFVSSTKKDKNTWMNLAELSNLNDEDFVVYTATKVSVSGTVNDDGTIDYDVKDGDQVVIYTRIWNDNTKRYDYYTIDYDGMLVQAYESGDTISWVGSKVNTMMWDFTEYHYDDGTPNYYYELQNTYSGKYMAPQVTGGGAFLSDHTIGINLNGRRNMEYYTTVLAWDDPYYDYASLKVQNMKLTSAPISKADTFYFAVMSPSETGEELGTVETVDNNAYGITVKMQNYPYQGYYVDGGYRSKTQSDILGRNSESTSNSYKAYEGLLTKNLQDDGYPKTTVVAQNANGQADVSLGNLFNDTLTVNHQFLMNTYKETGYFEYDCTQNFAHLIWDANDPWIGVTDENGHTYAIGDFVVYDQIGTSDLSSKASLQHGQFLPYNDLTDGVYSKKNPTNETDLKGNALSSLNPRKGEALYGIPADFNRVNGSASNPKIPPASDVNYFFGMEMSASFMQSESGLDAWGHDLIFEFSGDDDFWLYVDGMLVLDLGGVHSAIDGSINFRTGKVNVNGTQTTLRALYKEAYLENHPDAADETVEAWLDGIFKANEAGEKTVFHDYSGHTMKMFYMERGSQASNLHMRFNLAPYTEGEVLLEKEVSGIEQPDASMRFPFRIEYQDPSRPDDLFVPVTNTDSISVTDAQTGDPIPYQGSYTVDGLTYNNVFFLTPGQTASIRFDNEDIVYRIVECGMDTEVYDSVTVNHGDVAVTANDTSVANRKDYQIVDSSVSGRKKVIYDNHVRNDAQKSLYITKKLWEDNEKQHEITNDTTGFKFRVYIGKDGTDYTVYNTGKYYVKNPNGYYCIYKNGSFVSTGKTVFSDLSTTVPEGEWKSEQESATFYTSPGGAIDKIPAGYTIEIPGLMSGTDFQVIERDYEIPAGYHLIDYDRDNIPTGETANAGTVRGDHTEVIVNNQHGYGLIVNKIWSDAPFMEDHDEIHFAVYLQETDGSLTLVDGSLRTLGGTETQIRWFFPELAEGKTLNDYLVYEVTVDNDGHILEMIEENGTISVGGTSNEHGYSMTFEYTTNYDREMLTSEQIAADVNSRTDNVSNARPGIKIVKTDLEGKLLEGGVFTLIRGEDQNTKKTFTSDINGLIAVAYLTANEDYTLTEVTPPYRYLSLMDPITIRVGTDNTVYVNGSAVSPESGLPYEVVQVANPTASDMPTITVKNKPFALTAVKKDAVSGLPIQGVTFELHREVTDYVQQVPMPDYPPMDEFEALVTDEEGTIPKINLYDLSVGTYYLREKSTPLSYKELGFDIRLIIAPTGEISVQKAVYSSEQNKWVFSEFTNEGVELVTNTDGSITLVVKNQPSKPVRILKKGYGTNVILSGASFELYKYTQIDQTTGLPKDGEHYLLAGTTGADGILELGALERNTTYALIETAAPNGYNLPGAPIIITVMNDGELSAQLNSSALTVETVEDVNTTVSQITVYNSTGYELPSTGGIGDLAIQLPGAVLALIAAVFYTLRRRKYDR